MSDADDDDLLSFAASFSSLPPGFQILVLVPIVHCLKVERSLPARDPIIHDRIHDPYPF
ncbi:uncharacterized protein BDW47DRAFT_112117 [Aspergillus candidus]|uniref:Uncharacterized protein n=1 Tax=Aspergillus candidus TaxID=41067 RepID=A0A2I2F1E2_ASPCN|nr:hypothetical protein BDW47DRAFT_112117 [Aspergillus candidus]PLB34454.1 hypothetical protein BDW47DRAFT_112117 [Aspergillus candidus]